MNLTESQRRAIEHDGRNLQLIACAGSGKTEVVARRVVHPLTPGRPDSLVPGNIVAFTFTEKAAAELKERIVTRTRQTLREIPGMAEMFVGTIHAFCLELLKSESPKHLKFEILNEVQLGCRAAGAPLRRPRKDAARERPEEARRILHPRGGLEEQAHLRRLAARDRVAAPLREPAR